MRFSYEAGAIISENAMLTAGWADYVQLADSPYRRRFAPLVSAGVRLGFLICVDTDGHLEKIPPQTWELVEHILSKQMFVEASHQDKLFETAEDILMPLLDGGFSSAAHFPLQASGTRYHKHLYYFESGLSGMPLLSWLIPHPRIFKTEKDQPSCIDST